MNKIQMPNQAINISHYPDRKCRKCECNLFDAAVMIKFNPLNTLEQYIIPVYTCKDCGELLEDLSKPKKAKQ